MLITPGLLTALAFFILIMKLRHNTIRRLLGFDIYIDLLATAVMMFAFAGTFGGMMAAIIGGLTFSIALILAKKIYGYDKLIWINNSDHLLPTARWVSIPGMLRRRRRPSATHTASTAEDVDRVIAEIMRGQP